MVSKILNTVSTIAVSGVLLGSVFTTTSKAMEEMIENSPPTRPGYYLPIEAATRIAHYSCEVFNVSEEKMRSESFQYDPEMYRAMPDLYKTDWETLKNIRLVSHVWKEAANHSISKYQLLTIFLGPENYGHEELAGIAPLVGSINFNTFKVKNLKNMLWDKTTSKNIGTALFKNTFSNVCNLTCDMRDNPIGKKGLLSLVSTFSKLPKLNGIHLLGGIDDKGGKILGKSLQHVPNLRQLVIHDSNMDRLGLAKLVEGITHNHKNFSELFVEQASIGDAACYTLAKKLKDLESLTGVSVMRYERSGPSLTKEFENYFERKVKKHRPELYYDLSRTLNTKTVY